MSLQSLLAKLLLWCGAGGPLANGSGAAAASLPESIEDTNEELAIPLLDPDQEKGKGNASWPITIVTLLSLQLGWGLWYCSCLRSYL